MKKMECLVAKCPDQLLRSLRYNITQNLVLNFKIYTSDNFDIFK